jgi:hypothetical protein
VIPDWHPGYEDKFASELLKLADLPTTVTVDSWCWLHGTKTYFLS